MRREHDMEKPLPCDAAGVRFPTALASTALVLTAAVFAWLTWNAYEAFSRIESGRLRQVTIERLSADISRFDEILTMSARLAAATGAGEWVERYRESEPRLAASIRELEQVAPPAARPGLDRVRIANAKLVEVEHRALAIATAGPISEALALLSAPGYLRDKSEYEDGLHDVVSITTADLELSRIAERKAAWNSLAGVCAALVVLLGIWLAVVRNVRRWQLLLAAIAGRRETAEKMARESESQLKLLLDSTAEGIYGIDEDGRCSFVNRACLELLGYTEASQLLGQQMHSLIHHSRPNGDSYPIEDCPIYRGRLTGEGVHHQDEWLWRRDGTGFPVQYHSYPVVRDGTISGLVVTFMDATERRRAETELRESQERLHLALRSSRIGTWDWLIVEDRVVWDDYLPPLYGLRSGQFGGNYRSFVELVHPRDRERLTAKVSGAVKEGVDYEAEYRVLWPDDSVHWLCSRGRVYQDPSGRPVRMTGVTWEITASKEAETSLRWSETRYRSLVLATSQIVWSTDADGQVFGALPDWQAYTGQSTDEVQGQGWSAAIHPDDTDRVLSVWRRAVESGNLYDVEYRIRRADGAYREFLVRGVPVRNQDGMVAEWIGTCTDITDRKAAAADLQKLNRELEVRVADRTSALENALEEVRQRADELSIANRELESFSYSVAHDLRAPLRHIDGFTKILMRRRADQLDETSTHYLQTITQASARMGRLIDDLLAFSRTGRTEMVRNRIDLSSLIDEVRVTLEPDMEGRRFTWELGPLPVVMADRTLMRMAWTNLLSNAIKYTGPRDEARISIGTVPLSQCRPPDSALERLVGSSPDAPVLFIRDNGVGFDPQYSHKLFGVFQRLHAEDEFEGTGIGLATVRRVVEKHGGRVWGEGKIDGGATFYMMLPASPVSIS